MVDLIMEKCTCPAVDPAHFTMITGDGLATIVAAAIAASVAIWGYRREQRAMRRERRATLYSEALRTVGDYLEAPYLVIRRDGSAAARMAITSQISAIQSELTYYQAMLDLQAPSQVADAFRKYVACARKHAGPELTAAWKARPTKKDRDVPLGNRLDRTQCDAAGVAYLAAIDEFDPHK